MAIDAPRDAIDRGIYLVPEDRKRSGLLLDVSIAENIALPDLARYARGPILLRGAEAANAERQRASLGIRAPSVATAVGSLSGGNQQKVVLAKWLSMRPKVVIFDEPTRGVDVGAKSEIYALMRGLADGGVAILMISSDMEEVIGVSDRIAVMHEGAIAGFLDRGRVQRAQRAAARRRQGSGAGGCRMLKKELGLLLLILIVGAVVAVLNPRFLSPINLSNTANLIGLFGLFSLAQAFVIISGGIELSVGSIIALLGVVFVDLIANVGVPWGLALPLVVGIGMAMGVVHGLLITRIPLQPFVVTLCGLLIYRGIARWYTEDATAGFAFGQKFPWLEWLTTGRTLGVPHSMLAFAVVALVLAVALHQSIFGRYLYAVGKNEEAARYSGVRTQRIIVAAYVVCCGLTALAAVFIAMYTRSISPSSHGNFYELYAIAACVLGGCSLRGGEGSILGVVLGTILLQVLQNLVNLLGIPSSLNFAVMGGVILLGVIADQELQRRRQGATGGRGRPAQKEPAAAKA